MIDGTFVASVAIQANMQPRLSLGIGISGNEDGWPAIVSVSKYLAGSEDSGMLLR
jgi:hypothetical protein